MFVYVYIESYWPFGHFRWAGIQENIHACDRDGYQASDNIDPSIAGVTAYAYKSNGDVSYNALIPRIPLYR